MNQSTEALAILSGLSPDWANQFSTGHGLGINIQETNPNDSDRSVADTIALMGSHANAASVSPQVVQAVADAGVKASDSDEQKIQKVYSYIKSHVRFTEDESQLANIFALPSSKELLITPPVLLSMGSPQGDCDDFSMLACSMLMTVGVQCDFVTIAAEQSMPNQFTHVYCQVTTSDGQSMPFDASHGKAVGWESPRIYRKMIWPVFSFNKGKGLGMTLRQRAGLGDDLSIFDNYSGAYLPEVNYTPPAASMVPYNVASSGPSVWNSILPGLFSSVEHIAIQTTQQPGMQTSGPNGTSSYVLPKGASSLSIPSFGGNSINPLFLIGGVALVALFAFKK